VRYIRAECENGHGQDIRFGSPPDAVPVVGGVALHVPTTQVDRTVISSKLGTHPIYVDNRYTDVDLFCELIQTSSRVCGVCGGRVAYEVQEEDDV